MKTEDLLTARAQLTSRMEAIDTEKVQLARKLKAIDVLLEGAVIPELDSTPFQALTARQASDPRGMKSSRKPARHAVRFSTRSSLIEAVQAMAMKQPEKFDSTQLLKALQVEYPEFKLTETKHISSPLSDLVKKGVLVIERERSGTKPNIYRVAEKARELLS